jgi:hypothetical protein
MRTIAASSAQASEGIRTIAGPQTFVVWLVPILYPLSLSATFRSAEVTRMNVLLGSGLLTLTIAWSVSGPVAGWRLITWIAADSTAAGTA